MRSMSLLTISVASVALAAVSLGPAHAFGWDRLVPGGPDPYAYSYEPRPYYPYYNSGYWRPAIEMKGRYRYSHTLPKYYPAWGYPLDCGPGTDRPCPPRASYGRGW